MTKCERTYIRVRPYMYILAMCNVVFSRVAEPRVKILLLVFMSEIKIDLTLKRSNFLFLLCFKVAIIKFIPVSQQRNSFFSSRFTSNLMLPAYLLGMILVVNKVCNSKIS